MAIGAAIAAAAISAGGNAIVANKQSKSREGIAGKQREAAKKQRDSRFQESERQIAATRASDRFQQQAGQQIIGDRARERGLEPVFSDLATSVLSPSTPRVS